MRAAWCWSLFLAACAAPGITARVPPPELAPTDELSQADVQRTIAAHLPDLQACADAQRRRAPDARGKLSVQFHIQQTGLTSDVQARGEPPPGLATCVTEVFVAMRFRRHKSDPEPVIWPMRY